MRQKVDHKRVFELIQKGLSGAQISARTGASKSVIWNLIRKAKQGGAGV